MVVCTHNSRRSQLGEFWLQVAAFYYGMEDRVQISSAGTEATAFHPNAIAAIERAGGKIKKEHSEKNAPFFIEVDTSKVLGPFFSKALPAPTPDLVRPLTAIMVCEEAAANCPFVPGASHRFSLPFNDPRHSDGTPEETTKYDQSCREIAVHAFYLMENLF